MNSFYKEANAETNHTSSSYVAKVTITEADVGGSFAAGDYLIVAAADVRCSATGASIDDAAVLQVDGVTVGGHDLRVLTANDYFPFWCVKRATLTSGSHTIRIATRDAGGAENVHIRNARILLLWNISGLQYAESDGVTTTTLAALANKVALSFVPAPDTYLLLASWEQKIDATGDDVSVLVENAAALFAITLADQETILQQHAGAGAYERYNTFGACQGRQPGGGLGTWTIRHASTAGGVASIRRARIALVPCLLNGIILRSLSALGTAFSTVSTSFVEALANVYGLHGAGQTLLFLQGTIRSHGARIGVRHDADGVTVGEILQTQLGSDPAMGSPLAHFFSASVGAAATKYHKAHVLNSSGSVPAVLDAATLTAMTIEPVTVAAVDRQTRYGPAWTLKLGIGS